jgi:uncharacterized protein YbjT (DUF2867 family)
MSLQTSPPRRILVLGGTGFVGHAFLSRWVSTQAGAMVIVPSRRPERVKALASLPGVSVVAADVHDPAQLTALTAGCDAVVNLVAILHGTPEAFEKVHVRLAESLGVACRKADVRQLVHVSALGVPDDGEAAPSNYLRTKARGERVLRSCGVPCTVLRPSVIFGEHDRFTNLFAGLQRLAPVLPLAGAGARFQPVWVEDVAQAIVVALMKGPQTAGVIECAGPDVYTLGDLVRLSGAWSGHRRPVWPMPPWVGQVQAAVLGLLPGEPMMSADNLASMQVPNVAQGRWPGLASLGIRATALATLAPTYLRRPKQDEDRWRSSR